MTRRDLQIHTRLHQIMILRWCSLLGSKYAQIIFQIMMMAFFISLSLDTLEMKFNHQYTLLLMCHHNHLHKRSFASSFTEDCQPYSRPTGQKRTEIIVH